MGRPFDKLLVVSAWIPVLVLGCQRWEGALPEPAGVLNALAGGDPYEEVVTRTVSAELPLDEQARLPEPTEAVKVWRKWRGQKRYRLLEACIEPAQRGAFVDTLVTVDLVLAANQEVRRTIAELLGDHRTELWDLSALGRSLGIFSEDIRIISVARDSDGATIAFQVGDRLPLETARLRAGSRGWVYSPGVGPRGLSARLRNLAVALWEVAEFISRERPGAARINQEFRLRIFPRLKALEQLGAGSAEGAA